MENAGVAMYNNDVQTHKILFQIGWLVVNFQAHMTS